MPFSHNQNLKLGEGRSAETPMRPIPTQAFQLVPGKVEFRISQEPAHHKWPYPD